MEKYEGVKFCSVNVGRSFKVENELVDLNRWTFILSELGLTPLHSSGASGNQSYRYKGESFCITKSGMVPQEHCVVENFCKVVDCNSETGEVFWQGDTHPSSESFLHHLIYDRFPSINCILHGHSSLFLKNAQKIALPVSKKYCDYGTVELGESALEVVGLKTPFIILKDHGFVAMGVTIQDAGKLVIDQLQLLLEYLKNR